MGIGLTFEEYVDLRLNPRTGADRAFHEAAQEERERMFPMHTTLASHHLRRRGYDKSHIRRRRLTFALDAGVGTAVKWRAE